MNVGEWSGVAERIADVWGSKVSREMAAAWYVDLQGHNVADVRNAVVTLARSEDRRPSLARLLKETRDQRRERVGVAPQDVPGMLPDGVCAVIRSSTHQDVAVMGAGPWMWAQCNLPVGFEATEVIGVQPS